MHRVCVLWQKARGDYKETMAEGLIQDETSNVTSSKGGDKILGVNSQSNLPMQIRMLPVLVDLV